MLPYRKIVFRLPQVNSNIMHTHREKQQNNDNFGARQCDILVGIEIIQLNHISRIQKRQRICCYCQYHKNRIKSSMLLYFERPRRQISNDIDREYNTA